MQDFLNPITENFFIGINDNLPPHEIGKGYFVKANNAFLADRKIVKVAGSSAIAVAISSQLFNGFSAFENIASASKYLIANIDGASNAQLYQWTGSGAFTAIGSANLTNAKQMWFETAANSLYGANGTEVVDYDGTTVTKNRAGIPIVKYFSWFHNYLFGGNNSSAPNRLYWSNLGTPNTFSGANYVDVNPGDTDQIMGFGKIQDEIVVFKRNTIWSITGFSGASFSATTLATQNTNARIFGYGTTSPFSIVPVGNDIYFFSTLGNTPCIRSLKLTSFAKVLGGGIITNDITGTMDEINRNALEAISSGFDGRYAYWSIPTGASTTNNKIIALDTWKIQKYGGSMVYPWITMTGKNASYIVTSTISGSGSQVFFTNATATGKVFKIDNSIRTDDGANIEMDVITRNFSYDLARKMKWKYCYVRYDTGVGSALTIKARIDNASDFGTQQAISLLGTSPGLGPTGTFMLGISTLGGNTTTTTRVTLLHLTGKLFQIKFTESSDNEVTIHDYQVYALPKGLRAN